ncbi:serine hydrolase domain-containing protein [Micromonospora polyrhachis]|uniref:CubicO group peptidase (Beta-lactamase class C family) n=1 Tax=Micromonospora polyrhachis TaxID=1282883 RepID=A0A7W7WT41_9ACTN|nr:serine hydrolase domain-containing protein [Micromonospora polyrhachis]MBB4962267.1 CubicO group peptidase (beta-lactamase class C family) [Micromonospora polyrhachis]
MITRILALAGAVTLAASPTPTTPLGPPAGVDASAIDTVVREYRDATGLPGAAVTVTRGSTVVHAAGYGHTPAGDPITAHTPMAVASVSKSFTALAVMQLVEAGRVALDGPVQAYLPEFTMADPRAGQITVRQLLNQTSGMSDTTYRSFSRRPVPRSLQEAVATMRTARLAADPGTRWEYHNPNFQVAARLVEVVSGRSFDDYLRQQVFGPLGMTDSRTANVASDLPPSARGHLMILGMAVAVPEPPAFGNGSGGVLSSAYDMAAWLIAHGNQGRGRNGTAIISPAGLTTLHTPSTVSGSYALGWSIATSASGAPVIEHSGDLFTSTAYQALLPASGYGVAVMANTGLAHGDASALIARIIALLEGTPVPSTGTPLLVIDGVLLALASVTALLAGWGVLRARRWAAGRRAWLWTVARLLPLLLPLLLFSSIHHVVSVLYRGRDVAWIQVTYLYPTFMVLLGTAMVGCIAVLVARLTGLARVGREVRAPKHPTGTARGRTTTNHMA